MPEPLSQALRTAAARSGLSCRALSRAAGMDHRPLGRFLRGQELLRGPSVDRLAAALGLELVGRGGRRIRARPRPRILIDWGRLGTASYG